MVRPNQTTAKRTSLKKKFALFQSLSRLFLSEFEFQETIFKLESGIIKIRRCLFTFSIKDEIRHFHVVVVEKRQRNVQKSVMHVQSF